MSRIARVVIPGIPHHIVQRGNRRQTVFFNDQDRIYYLRLLKKYGLQAGLEYWAYCFMPNHVHLVAIPNSADSLAEVMAAVNRKYAIAVNLRQDWRGCLWQGRFYSCPLDYPHLLIGVRYIERNPVRAGIVEYPGDFPWSSAKAHIEGKPDELIAESPLSAEVGDWAAFLCQDETAEEIKRIKKHLVTGRPLGDEEFIERLERLTGRNLRKQKTGPKSRLASPDTTQLSLIR